MCAIAHVCGMSSAELRGYWQKCRRAHDKCRFCKFRNAVSACISGPDMRHTAHDPGCIQMLFAPHDAEISAPRLLRTAAGSVARQSFFSYPVWCPVSRPAEVGKRKGRSL